MSVLMHLYMPDAETESTEWAQFIAEQFQFTYPSIPMCDIKSRH